MIIRMDFESETPIYIQLKNQIIMGIAKGELEPGESLPSVRQMAADIGINMHTVNKAYNLLKADEFISMDRRKGAVVNSIKTSAYQAYMELLKEELQTHIASAICKGVSEADYLELCKEIFNEYK